MEVGRGRQLHDFRGRQRSRLHGLHATRCNLRAFFLPPATLGQASLSGYKIEVRAAEDDEKDAVARTGQARSKLYFIGTNTDWVTGAITQVCEPVFSENVKATHSKPRSAQVDATQFMIQLAVETGKSEDPTSIYSKFASIDVV